MSDNQILLVAEQADGRLNGSTLELVTAARQMADAAGARVTAVVAGSGVRAVAEELAQYNVDRIVLLDDARLGTFTAEAYTSALVAVIAAEKPTVVVLASDRLGRELAPRLGARLGCGLATDCTGLALDAAGRLTATRPAYGGNVVATISYSDDRPQIATVRPRAFARAARGGAGAEISSFDLQNVNLHSPAEVIGTVVEAATGPRLEEADIVVSGGRGMGGPEGFHMIEELAGLLGAAIGASRAVVDAGWMPYANQVGQTGKTVSPKLYIACGISGAIQHLAGMKSSRVVVAINKNPDAPIFRVADFGIVGDVNEVLPEMIRQVRAMLGK